MSSPTTAHGWQLQEDSASAYERYLVPLLFEAGARHLVDSVRLAPGERILDVACGTGVVARTAARRVGPSGAVTGVDLNAGMLAVARAASAGAATPIRWVEASAEDLPLPDGTVDVACCQQGLQFFTDRAAALTELRRVLVPGGRLGLNTCRPLEHQPGYVPLVEALRRHVGEPAAAGMASPFSFGDPQKVRLLVAEAGFGDVEVRIVIWPVRLDSPEAFLRGETASSPLGGVIAALDADVTEALLEDLVDGLGPHTDDAGISFPFETLVVTATR
jgi:ubiquinone/menaquinone biosynthesis C-methylase UbiE